MATPVIHLPKVSQCPPIVNWNLRFVASHFSALAHRCRSAAELIRRVPTVIFADLNDDGKADVACVAKNGDTSAWLNTGPVAGQWSVQNQIKAGIGGDQANIRFADINGGLSILKTRQAR